NESGNSLKPNATYRLPPGVADDTILPYKGSVAQLKVPAMSRYSKPEEALAALDAMRLSVKASLKGYEDLAEERAMAQLLRGSNGELKGIIDVKFVMKGKQEGVEVIPTKGPGGLEAIVYFSTNVSNRLNNEKASGLKNVVDLWNKQPHKYVYVYGHADSRGTSAHNMKLSKARAEFVKRRLVEYGIPSEMIITRAFGETRPVSKDESTLEGRRKNRRAEIYFDATKRKDEGEPTDSEAVKEAPKPAVKKPAKKKKSKPLPPEEVEPSVKVKPVKKVAEESAKTETAAPSKPESATFTAPATDKPASDPGTPPNTELRIK
ncbi:MAG TPA: OmpA family protein, partial [Turneriella sp.]|nr:OmpA family protein [Turneriella sp.]